MDTEIATLGGGCFWCIEAVFRAISGVVTVKSGYAGGDPARANYPSVCSGDTGHAEVVQVTYDPNQISYQDILEIFFTSHDPTTLNRQGNDVGSQYRSVIFTHDDAQRKIAEEMISKLNNANLWPDPLVTQVVPLSDFFPAEDYHDDYYALNANKGYCQLIIAPKLEKIKRVFADKLKS